MKLYYLRKGALLILGIFILGLGTSIAQASNVTTDTSEILVEIIVNSKGDSFAEEIEFEDGTKLSDYNYTIKYVQTPRNNLIQEYFHYAAWISRNSEITLSLDPKSNVRKESKTKDKAWDIISSPTQGFGNDPYWNNNQVMGWQYDCHYSFAPNKDYWNLEPHRTASSYLQVVLAACNP